MEYVPEQIKDLLRPFRRSVQAILRPLVGGSIRATNPFASHIPVLMGLARLFRVQRVLEFGSGEYSTLTFLNRTAFPHLARLVSFENDLAWTRKVESMANGDPRAELHYTDRPVFQVAQSTDSAQFDLIFIDDSLTTPDRVATISTVVGKLSGTQLALIHDYECQDYQLAARAPCNFRFDAVLPNTGLASKQLPFANSRLNHLQRVIRANGDRVSASDVEQWARIFDKKL